MVHQFVDIYHDELVGTRVIHDGGNSFKDEGELILEEVADIVHVQPSLSHGVVSVCDNNRNAVIKNQWRAERAGECEWVDALYLLWCCDWLEPEQTKANWVQNFHLGNEGLSLTAVADRLTKVKSDHAGKKAREEQYVSAYLAWAEEHEEVVPSKGLVVEEGGLDGSYWK